jgi:hypothetical protein
LAHIELGEHRYLERWLGAGGSAACAKIGAKICVNDPEIGLHAREMARISADFKFVPMIVAVRRSELAFLIFVPFLHGFSTLNLEAMPWPPMSAT